MRSFASGRWGSWASFALPVALALFVTACGSSSSSSSSAATSAAASTGTASTSSGADLAALQTAIAPYTKAPASIGPTVPISKPIPKGKSFVFINCGAPACTDMQDSFDAAASYLGWHVTNITTSPTPEGIQASFAQAVRDAPSAVVSSGFALNQFPEQAKQLNAMKIPIIMNTGTDPSTYDPSNGITLQLQPPSEVQQASYLMADRAVIDAGGKGEFGTVLLTGYPSVANNVANFTARVEKVCSACTVKSISIQPTSLGTNAASLIANFLRANPGIKGLYFGYADMAVGLSAAAKGAGIALPKMYAWAPDADGIQQLNAGTMTAAVPLCYVETGWQFADAAARLLTGSSVKDSQPWQNYVLWSKQYGNVPTSVNNPPCIADYKAQFQKLWH
jgi:ABC-type sugar transport system substrate-binding protein